MKTRTIIMTAAILGLCLSTYCQDAPKQGEVKPSTELKKNGPVARFDKTEYDFSDLIQNSPGTATFILTNDGNEPLLISSATASCGCTNLSYSKEPVLPGKSTSISATYNAAAPGNFFKSVTVRTNASDQTVILQIKGKVIPKS
ncbi:MAG: DUF1573 domain-containing protein [Bacteroidetes bacterium]|nr:DUF1573 domain-containing protein [Bacteroidota bacterium]